MGALKDYLRDTFLGEWVRVRRSRKALADWEAAGRPAPPPHAVKQRAVTGYAVRFGCKVLVETGTYYGDMVYATKSYFDRVVSIEVDAALHERAVKRFARWRHVEIRRGDSEQELPKVLETLATPALFWLDGHFSGGVTSKGRLDTPIVAELKSVLSHRLKSHVVLVDDAREFSGKGDYPGLDEVRALVDRLRPGSPFEVADDIIRILPPA